MTRCRAVLAGPHGPASAAQHRAPARSATTKGTTLTIYELPDGRPEITLVGPDDANFWRMLGVPADGKHALVFGPASQPTAATVLVGSALDIHQYLIGDRTGLRDLTTRLSGDAYKALTPAEHDVLYPPVTPPAPPTPDPVLGLTTLPHSKLKVPDTRLTVTGYRGHGTSDGEAFAAKLRLDNRIVGTVENSGVGGPTTFYPAGNEAFTWRDLEEFASRCRDDNDCPVDSERVLDALIDEAKGDKDVQKAIKAGAVPARRINTYSSGIWGVCMVASIPAAFGHEPRMLAQNSVWRRKQNELLLNQFGKQDTTHWEVWTGTEWVPTAA